MYRYKLILSLLLYFIAGILEAKVCPTDTLYNYDYSQDSTIKRLTGRSIYTYLTGDTLSEYLTQNWDEANLKFVDFRTIHYSYNQFNLLVETLYLNWDPTKKQWVNSSIYSFQYDANNRNTDYIFQTWNISTSQWEAGIHIMYQYDQNGNTTEKIVQQWNNPSAKWVNYAKESKSYDSSNNETESSNYNWLVNTAVWEGDKKHIYVYDNKNNQTEIYDQRWIPFTSEWVYTGKTLMTYNAQNLRTSRHGFLYISSIWKNYDLSLFSYNGSGLVTDINDYGANPLGIDTFYKTYKYVTVYDTLMNKTGETTLGWMPKNNTFLNIFRNIFGYDKWNYLNLFTFQIWDSSANVWKNNYRNTYTYDADSNILETTYETIANNAWRKNNRHTYEYSTDGKQIAHDYYSNRDTGNKYFQTHTREEFLCRFVPNTNVISGTIAEENMIYPNPNSSGYFIVNSTTDCTFVLYDIYGKILQTGEFSEGENRLDCGNVGSGIYLLQFSGYTARLLIE